MRACPTHAVSIRFHKKTQVVVKFHYWAVVKLSVCHSAVSFISLSNVIFFVLVYPCVRWGFARSITAVFNIWYKDETVDCFCQ